VLCGGGGGGGLAHTHAQTLMHKQTHINALSVQRVVSLALCATVIGGNCTPAINYNNGSTADATSSVTMCRTAKAAVTAALAVAWVSFVYPLPTPFHPMAHQNYHTPPSCLQLYISGKGVGPRQVSIDSPPPPHLTIFMITPSPPLPMLAQETLRKCKTTDLSLVTGELVITDTLKTTAVHGAHVDKLEGTCLQLARLQILFVRNKCPLKGPYVIQNECHPTSPIPSSVLTLIFKMPFRHDASRLCRVREGGLGCT
jgi:hypothetical protein